MRCDELKDAFKEKGVLLFDAAMGTALQAAGQPAGNYRTAHFLAHKTGIFSVIIAA